MWRPDVSLEAELEIFEAALRDQRERAALGFRFEAQVNTVFARLLENPFQFPRVEEERSPRLGADGDTSRFRILTAAIGTPGERKCSPRLST